MADLGGRATGSPHIAPIRLQELRTKMLDMLIGQLLEESEFPLGDRYELAEAIKHLKKGMVHLVKYKDPYL